MTDGSISGQMIRLGDKISYLRKVLHKKDKHSLKGLKDMIAKHHSMMRFLQQKSPETYKIYIKQQRQKKN